MIADKYEKFRPDVNFIKKYMDAQNAASGSDYDPNSNVSSKNLATLASETGKRARIYTNRLMMHDRISELYGEEEADQYISDLESHHIYRHDETGQIPQPYCCSVSMYPFLLHGLKGLGGSSDAPKNLQSFSGGFVNLVFALSAQVLGAVATPEWLAYTAYFLTKDYGADFFDRLDEVVDLSNRHRTIDNVITDMFAQVVYSINQPAAARGNQAVFWNVAYFDKPYFESLFEDFVFPDGTLMTDLWSAVRWTQRRFMEWFNEERRKKILTFPVETFSLLNDGYDFVDQDAKEWVATMYSKGHSFFTYTSDSVDSLSSCCRLRSSITENTFSFSLGAGGISTGSKCVMTININRLVQDAKKNGSSIPDAVREQTMHVHKYLKAFNSLVLDAMGKKMIPLYDAGFVSPDKQYLTVGINGLVEGAQFLGIEIGDNESYHDYVDSILSTIHELNVKDKETGIMFNTEYVPAESLGVKNATWDKKDGYFVPRDCYNSYFYVVEDKDTSILDKIRLHGDRYISNLDGGSAAHLNLEEHLTKPQYKKLMEDAVHEGCSYFTFNVPNTVCRDCGHISKHNLSKCPKCGSENVDYATKIIGYLTLMSKWSKERQSEGSRRYYDSKTSSVL